MSKSFVALALALTLSSVGHAAFAQSPEFDCLWTGTHKGKAIFLGANRTLADFEAAIRAHKDLEYEGIRKIGDRLALSFSVVDQFAETKDRWSLELRRDAESCWRISRAKVNDEQPLNQDTVLLIYPMLATLFPTNEAVGSEPRRIPRADIGTRSQ